MRLTNLSLGIAFGLLASVSAFAADSATKRLHPKAAEFEFEGPFGTYDRGALQRGYQVYKEVCAACHAANLLSFRNLAEPGGPGLLLAFQLLQLAGAPAGGRHARPSGTEDVYKLYAESFVGEDHLKQIQRDAQASIDRVLEGS